MTATESSHDHTHHEGHDDHDGHGEHGEHGDESMPTYLPPRQRQRWSDHQAHPHTDWGDIFFDLFYVAAAYNLGNLLREDPSTRGLLYLAGCFFPIMSVWLQKMYHASRFYNPDDIVHRLFEVASLVPLATSVLHIRTVPILSDPKNHVDMFAFSLSITIAHVLMLARSLEVMICQSWFQTKGLYVEAYRHSRRDCIWVGIPLLFYAASTIYAGMEYYGENKEETGSDYHRILAGSEKTYSGSEEDDIPVYLNLAAVVVSNVALAAIVFVLFGDWRNIDHKEYFVPMNIDYGIHRWGEWTMLLLGESVLSLLIVDLSEGFEYYITFFAGVVTVILLQVLHFRSQARDADHHALRRSKAAAMSFTTLMWFYSVSLIILGTSYKMFLFEFVYEDDEAGKRRNLSPLGQRILAGATTALRFETDDRQQRIANFFSGSFAVVFCSLDLSILAHGGINHNMARLNGLNSFRKYSAVILVAIRLFLIIFIATLSLYVTEPRDLAVTGAASVFVQLLLRTFLNFVLPHGKELEDNALERVAAQLNARS